MSLFGIGAAAVANIAGGLIGTAMSGNSAKATANLQGQLQRENWEYAQKHAHQFEVEDLRAAGLNPILSATNGQLASMPGSVSASDNGVGSNVTSAFNALGKGLLEKEMQSKDLEIEKQRLENDALRLNNETRKIDADITYNNGMLGISQANSAINIKVNEARIKQVNQDISNSIDLTQAQVANLYSGAALNYATAEKVGAEIGKIIAETTNIGLDSQQIVRVLTDPRAEIERKEFARALEGQNLLGFAVKLGMYGKEFGSLFPSRVGVGLSRR